MINCCPTWTSDPESVSRRIYGLRYSSVSVTYGKYAPVDTRPAVARLCANLRFRGFAEKTGIAFAFYLGTYTGYAAPRSRLRTQSTRPSTLVTFRIFTKKRLAVVIEVTPERVCISIDVSRFSYAVFLFLAKRFTLIFFRFHRLLPPAFLLYTR